jgi:hypothetical protein
MALILRSPAARRCGFALGLAIAALLPSAAGAQSFCGTNSPGFPVPEFNGPTRLWPTNGFQPARPGQAISLDRDSTQYTSNSFPCAQSGHELFWALDIVGDRAFVMYNVGISAWDIGGANADNPRRISYRDGIAGHWLHHDGIGEADGYLKEISAIQDPANANRILIAVAGGFPIGSSLWRFDRGTGALTAVYQQTLLPSEDVELVVFGGRIYAIFAGAGGAFVIDVTATDPIGIEGCLDAACPAGIYLGRVGASRDSRYLGIIEKGGKIFMAASYGGLTSFSPSAEIWEFDPAFPAGAALKYTHPVKDTHSPVFFTKGGIDYLAIAEARRIKIFEIGACLDADGCSSLPTPVFTHQLRTQLWSYEYLTYSVSEGTPYLYYGFEGHLPRGPAYERLFDLTNLGGTNQLSEMTETGGTYTDECNGLGPIGYWASYYELNDLGFRNFSPRKAMFNGRYFYKINTGTFDVHVRTVVIQNPTVTVAPTSPAPYYFGDTVRFGATALNCTGPETWTWHSSHTGASGLDSTGNAASLIWPLCTDLRCTSQNVDVWALKEACSGSTNLTVNRATVQVADPRPQVNSIAVAPSSSVPDTYPLCSQLSFSADVSGKPPLSHSWTVKNAAGQQIGAGSSAGFGWNTDGVVLTGPEIFADGFESGDIAAWDAGETVVGTKAAAAWILPEAIAQEVMEVGSAVFKVELTASNSTGSPGSLRRDITLTALGELAFVGSPIQVTSLGGAQYRFRTTTENATRWRWEFEDPGNGASTGCQFFSRCRVIDFGADDNDVTYTWAQPNVDGTFRVRVSAGNCLTSVVPISAEQSVAVTGIPSGTPPAITSFSLLPSGHCSLSLNVMECHMQAITFVVSHSNTATNYDFDWEGDGVFEQSFAVGAAIAHTYPTVGVRAPKVRVRNGSGSPSAAVGLPWTLQIIE